MSETIMNPWVPVAVGAGAIAVVVAMRGVAAAVRLAVREVNYRMGMDGLDAVVEWFRTREA